MDENKKNSFVAGVGGILVSAALLAVGLPLINNSAGIFTVVFGAVFGVLGVGCIVKPETFGPVLIQIMENVSNNTNAANRPTAQRQHHSDGSAQVVGNNNTVVIQQAPKAKSSR